MSDKPGPWFKMAARDWIEATRDLGLDERGAYVDILCMIYDRDGPIPDDDDWISHNLHISARRWRPIRIRLLAANKLFEVDGGLHNRRAQSEIETRRIRRQINAENARSRGRNSSKQGEMAHTFNDHAEQIAQVSLTDVDANQDEEKEENLSNVQRLNLHARELTLQEREKFVEFLTMAVPALSPQSHQRWLADQVGRYGPGVVRLAIAGCRGSVEGGSVRHVHKYLEAAMAHGVAGHGAWGRA